TYFKEDAVPYEVLTYEHVKMGRGNATIRLRVKNLLSGATLFKSYVSGKRVEDVQLDKQRVTYRYRNATDFVFEQDASEDPVEFPHSALGDKGKFLKKGMQVDVLFYEERPIAIELPIKVAYVVKEAPPDARGNTVSGSYKEVLLENNLRVKVPMFVKDHDAVIIDTRTGVYVSRG
ncbi:elongation factor P, partial [Candidatus Roizmanbacteria bacterium]|nr:elongation factor P [Candidatus Roizmanbacteria bacterium]